MVGKPDTVDAYIQSLAPELQAVAREVRETVRAAAPQALEAISYSIPAIRVEGRTIMYFAVWKKHVGLYPIWPGDADYEAAVGPYRVKGRTVNLPLKAALPLDLIAQIVRAQIMTGLRA